MAGTAYVCGILAALAALAGAADRPESGRFPAPIAECGIWGISWER